MLPRAAFEARTSAIRHTECTQTARRGGRYRDRQDNAIDKQRNAECRHNDLAEGAAINCLGSADTVAR
jgi:hypothetical protein